MNCFISGKNRRQYALQCKIYNNELFCVKREDSTLYNVKKNVIMTCFISCRIYKNELFYLCKFCMVRTWRKKKK